MTEQKPHWINLTCMKCGYRYSGLTHAAPSACPNDGGSLVPYDPPAQRIASLEAELAQVKAERGAVERLCLELAVGLVKHGVHLFNCPVCNFGSTRCGNPGCECAEAACTCGFEALLSRPEVVKLLEEREAGRG